MRLDPEKAPPDIASKLRALQGIQERIRQLESELSQAREECGSLEDDLAQYQASISPIRNIPPEILTSIFEQYVMERPMRIRLLLLVCRLWYRLIMDTPSLWAHVRLVFDADTDSPTPVRNALKYARACYERSKQCPLHVAMDFSQIPSEKEFIDNRLEALDLFDPEELYPLSEDLMELECVPFEKLMRSCNKLASFVASRGDDGKVSRSPSTHSAMNCSNEFGVCSEEKPLCSRNWLWIVAVRPSIVDTP